MHTVNRRELEIDRFPPHLNHFTAMIAPLAVAHALPGRLLLGIHLLIWLVLAVYGLHRLHLIELYRRRARPLRPPVEPAEWPAVTIQLPIYNERYVIERLLEAAAAVDYPRGKLEIQVLDDSVDGTAEIAARKVAELKARGINAVHIRRADRQGYKAWALIVLELAGDQITGVNSFLDTETLFPRFDIPLALPT